MMQLREEVDAPPPLYRVQDMGAADPKAMEEDWERLQVGTPKGAVGEVTIYLRGAGQRF